MYLKSIELSGFKSFAKKVSLNFNSPVVAIVGPNGSGKSNVAEAFSFVLGEQSIKSMRGKRGEDLIWNGSTEAPRANRAVVKTVFDNSKKIFNLDFDEVSIERAVNRDGTNEYSLNGTQVRLKDVIELLANAHIGASGHHIISQGEADRILTSNAKERRAMIEDALGLKIYQYKKQESARKLEKTFENIAQVESLRREIAPHLKFLKKQVEKMGKAQEVKDKLAGLYREYLKREKDFIDSEKEKIKEEKKPLFEKHEKLKKNIEEGKFSRIENDIIQKRTDKDSFSREAGKLEGEINASERIIEKRRRESIEKRHITITIEELENLYATLERESEIAAIKKMVKDFIDSRKSLTEQSLTSDMEQALETLKSKKEEVEAKIKAKELEIKELEKEERETLELSSLESAIKSQLQAIHLREERLRLNESDFLREVEEAGVLLGSVVTGFASLQIAREEDRHIQEERRREVERMKIRLEELGAAGGEEVLNEYRETSERDAFLERELNDLHSSSESLKQLIADLEERLNVEFKEGIHKINSAFQKFFELMFGGGTAKLQVAPTRSRGADRIVGFENEENELESQETEEENSEDGLDINVSLPKKRVKGLQMLSGGERALTSIALLFAMSQVNPPPFIILDETDAALDEANSKKYSDMIESLSKYSQLILITHNRETMSRAGVIYGVTMGQGGISKLLSIAFDEAVAVAK